MLDMHEVIGSSPIIPTMRLVLCERVFLINIIYYVDFQIICEVLRRRKQKIRYLHPTITKILDVAPDPDREGKALF